LSLPKFAPSFPSALSSSHCQQEDFNCGGKGTRQQTKKQEKKKLVLVEGKKQTITTIPRIVSRIF